jgi:hypothetical protein
VPFAVSACDGVQQDCGSFTIFAAGGCDGRLRHARKISPTVSDVLGFELFQFFIDEVVSAGIRCDAHLLMTRALQLRSELEQHGVTQLSRVCKVWLHRWRSRYNVSIRRATTSYKVKRAIVVKRIGVTLGNIWRLRRLFYLCHGEAPRFLSLDQKPSWFNNAGFRPTHHTKGARQVVVREDHGGTRQRYTILTSVPSWDFVGRPPPVAVLFKAWLLAVVVDGAHGKVVMIGSCSK